MRKRSFAILLATAGCASAPAPVAYEPCPPGYSFIDQSHVAAEAYGVGGLGRLVLLPGSRLESIEGRAVGGPGEGLVLQQVDLVHTALPRGARSEGRASYRAPAGSRVTLVATSGVPGYGWAKRVAGTNTSFQVGCNADRPRHTVNWTFLLRDDQGRESKPAQVPMTCTGEPMPGSAPRLEAVDLDYVTLAAGQKSGGLARIRGGHPPLQFIADSNAWGYGWKSSPIPKDEADLDFAVGCRTDRPRQIVRWRFSVTDSYGRTSNVIEKPVNCGVCVKRKS
jgi:hypothetical protein